MTLKFYVCTINGNGNIDYGQPICFKDTDYRTSTGLYHRHIPPVPQHFDVYFKDKISQDLLTRDVALKKDNYLTTHNYFFDKKFDTTPPGSRPIQAINHTRVDYIRTIEEKMFMNPVRPMTNFLSTMKDEYRMPEMPNQELSDLFLDQCIECPVISTSLAENLPINWNSPGYMKYLDPYVSTMKASYLAPNVKQREGLCKRDAVTYWNATPPIQDEMTKANCEPLVPQNEEPMVDKAVFKTKAFDKIVPRKLRRVPHNGMITTYQGSYVPPCHSSFAAQLTNNFVECKEVFPDRDLHQVMTVPGMYKSEYSNIGSGRPVEAVIDVQAEGKAPLHPMLTAEVCRL